MPEFNVWERYMSVYKDYVETFIKMFERDIWIVIRKLWDYSWESSHILFCNFDDIMDLFSFVIFFLRDWSLFFNIKLYVYYWVILIILIV